MANKYLGRDDAPFGASVWQALDTAMIDAAKSQLVGRRLLHIEGPYGLGLKTVPMHDAVVTPGKDGAPDILASQAVPLALIRTTFTLATRDLASFEREAVALDLGNVARAAMDCARLEDDLIFNGSKALDAPGLLGAAGSKVQLSAWENEGDAAGDIIKAVTSLDDSGFHGPYVLALAPSRYNLLFRRYRQGNQTEMQHLQNMVSDGIFKAPILKDGGVLLNSGKAFASIVVGQDMMLGFVGPSESDIEFSISESLALRIRQPKAICVLPG
jgi:uncharacterized linocin/CFP29 family protein